MSLLGLLLLCCAAAWAQPPSPLPPAVPPGRAAAITDVRFGWQGAIVGERWNPIRVSITGGEKGFSGVLVAEFNQDASQAACIMTPAAATPGLTTPIDLAAFIPSSCERIQFTLLSETGFEVQRLVFDQVPGPDEVEFSPVRFYEQCLTLALGPSSLSGAIDAVPATTPVSATALDGIAPPSVEVEMNDGEVSAEFIPSPDVAAAAAVQGEALADFRWSSLKLARLEPASLPFLWTAYEAAQVLVIRTEAGPDVDPRAVDAVRAWVHSGGRLVLVVDAPGSRWRRWLPDGPDGELVDIGEVVRVAVPPAALAAIDQTEEAAPARDAQARPLQLTVKGAADAWALEWGPESDHPGAGLLAQGPVGFGWVTIVGVEPQSCLANINKPGLTALWRAVLAKPLDEWLTLPKDDGAEYLRYGGGTPGPTAQSRAALGDLLDRLTDAAPLGVGVVLIILFGMLLLTLLVGPVDALLLRRLQLRQHSWLTALGWITLMSLIAYVVPPLIRTGPDVIHRVRVVDILASPDAGPDGGSAWSTGVTSIFASRAGPIPLEPFDPGAWWRGVSSAYGEPGSRRFLPPLMTRIDTGGPGGQDLRSAHPFNLTQGQWTFRAVADDGPAQPGLSARLRRDDDHWQITLIGVPPHAHISQCDLIIAGRTHLVQWTSASSGTGENAPRIWRGRTVDAPEAGEKPQSARPDDSPPGDEPLVQVGEITMAAATSQAPPVSVSSVRPVENPFTATLYNPDELSLVMGLELAAPAQRAASIDARSRSGKWGQLRLLMTGLPSAYPASPEARQTNAAIYRVLIPIDGDSAPRSEDPS